MQNTAGPAVVHVRSLDLNDVPETAWPKLLQALDRAEKARADRFRFKADRRAYVAAHALLRHLLSELQNWPPSAWRFVADAYGKPELADPALLPGVRFNLSHTRGMVLVCVARGFEVGGDVEAVSSRRPCSDIAKRFFSEAEAASLREIEDTAVVQERFTALWTLKEAFVKAVGKGLSQPLDSFAFDLIEPLQVTFVDAALGDPGRWRFWRSRYGKYRFAVAFPAPAGCAVDVLYTRSRVSVEGTARLVVKPTA